MQWCIYDIHIGNHSPILVKRVMYVMLHLLKILWIHIQEERIICTACTCMLIWWDGGSGYSIDVWGLCCRSRAQELEDEQQRIDRELRHLLNKSGKLRNFLLSFSISQLSDGLKSNILGMMVDRTKLYDT